MMTKKRIFAALGWLLALLLPALAAFLNDSALALTLVVFVGALPLISLLVCLIAVKRLSCRLVTPMTAEKNAGIDCAFAVSNAARLFPGTVTATLQAKNLLTEEDVRVSLRVSPLPRRSAQTRFSLVSPHCGCFCLAVPDVRLLDWTGIFALKVPSPPEAICAVLPDIFPVAAENLPDSAPEADAERYSQVKPGSDPTELFELREYVPGDDLRRLHRKLSEKLDRPVVRLDALPLERSVLLLRDASAAAASPALRDAVTESMVSVGEALRRAEVRFCFGWHTPQGFFSVSVSSDQTMPDAVMALLGAPGAPADALTPAELTARERFGATVVFSVGDPLSPPENDARVLRFSEDGPLSPGNHTDVLSVIEL